jgi:Ca2+-binding EF-hand superfamily protein
MKLAGLLVVLSLTGVAHADHGPPRPRAQLRQLLLQHFDRNHDGRLEPRERKQAARALRRLAMRIEHGHPRAHRQRRFVQRFDLNHDGNVGPGELPPALADELRPLDRDGDGWLHGDELP